MLFRIMASRHSAFYAPLLNCVDLLRQEGHQATYAVLGKGQRSHVLLRDKQVDIMQSAVSSNWPLLEQGIEGLPVHFAQINQRDGFFLAGRRPEPEFHWSNLEGKTLLADHGRQPLVMLKYAVQYNGVDWKRINVMDAGAPDQMLAAYRSGAGDYLHAQGPVVTGEIVASVGASMPPVAFSSLCCARAYQSTEGYRVFRKAYQRSRDWVRSAPRTEVAARLASFFPDIGAELLVSSVERYQNLGCWEGGTEIPRDLYEQALTVFESAGEIARRCPYEEVVG